MRDTKEYKLLKHIADVELASIFNFQPFLADKKSAKTLVQSLQWPNRLFRRLETDKLIKRIELYPPSERNVSKQYRYNTFYELTAKALSIIPDAKIKNRGKISRRNWEHWSGLVDILLGLKFAYPDYQVKIEYEPTLKYEDKFSTPDAMITLTDWEFTEYVFLVEFERTRSPLAIKNEKWSVNDKINFKANGLPKDTKYLYVYTWEQFDVTTRPLEYANCQKQLDLINRQFKTLVSLIPNDPRYLCAKLHDCQRFNEAVWRDFNGQPRKLIH